MQRSAQGTASTLSKIGAGLKSLAAPAAAAAAAIGAAGTSLFRFVSEQASAAAAMNDAARAAGIGVEEFQRLRFAADQTGVSAETLQKGMTRFSATLLQIKQGSGKEAEKTLSALGLSIKDLDGLSRTQQIGLIGDRLQGVADASERSAIAAQLFGKSAGPEMAQLLAEGTFGIEALAAAAQGVLSADEVQRLADFDDAAQAMNATLTGLAQGIAADLAPAVQGIVQDFTDWIAANESIIRQDIGGAFEFITGQVKKASDTIDLFLFAVRQVDDVLKNLRPNVEDSGLSFSMLAEQVARAANPFYALVAAASDLKKELQETGTMAFHLESNLAAIAGRSARGIKPPAVRTGPAQTHQFPTQAQAGFEARARGGGGGGGRAEPTGRVGGIDISRAIHKWLTPEPSVENTIDALLSGQPGAMTQRLRQIANVVPSTKDMRPTIAMDVTINNMTNTFDIKSTDPKQNAREIVQLFEQRWQVKMGQANQALGNPIVR